MRSPDDVLIERSYRPGAFGRITEMHASVYARHAGFGQFFKSKVAAGLAGFTPRAVDPGNVRAELPHTAPVAGIDTRTLSLGCDPVHAAKSLCPDALILPACCWSAWAAK
jgi:hypothetical protein